MLRTVICIFVAMATPCVSNLARAQDDFYRGGCYLGLAGAAAFPVGAEDEVENLTGLDADASESFGLHARAGCRAAWGGGELHFEWLEGYDVKADGFEDKIDGWALTLDGKLYPLWLVEDKLPPLARRFQPFATVGFGYLTFDGEIPNFDEWDFAGRFGGGLDVYATRNIAISVDTTYVLPVTPALDHLDYVSVGLGVLFRF